MHVVEPSKTASAKVETTTVKTASAAKKTTTKAAASKAQATSKSVTTASTAKTSSARATSKNTMKSATKSTPVKNTTATTKTTKANATAAKAKSTTTRKSAAVTTRKDAVKTDPGKQATNNTAKGSRPSVKSAKIARPTNASAPKQSRVAAITDNTIRSIRRPVSPMAISSVGAVLAGTFAFAGLALAFPAVTGPLTGAGDSILTASVSPLSISTAFPYEGHVSMGTWQDAYGDETSALSSLISKSQRVEAANAGYIDEGTAAVLASARNEASEAMNTGAASNSIESIQTAYNRLDQATADAEKVAADARAAEEAAAKRAERLAAFTSGIDASDWSDDKIAFVAEWGPRVDAYLSGRPACGYGEYFAAAAYDYDVDPRIGAAIAVIESGAGQSMFRENNMWGWGSSSWGSMGEAIFEWTASFHRGYGYDMDYSDCQRYCPPNPGYYDKLRGQMEQI